LLKNTNLRLNIPLLGMDEWNEADIRKRGRSLAEIAIKIWPGINSEQGAAH
jgi:hypothetical protein